MKKLKIRKASGEHLDRAFAVVTDKAQRRSQVVDCDAIDITDARVSFTKQNAAIEFRIGGFQNGQFYPDMSASPAQVNISPKDPGTSAVWHKYFEGKRSFDFDEILSALVECQAVQAAGINLWQMPELIGVIESD